MHRQQGECERLIEVGSVAMDCKPTAVDFIESVSDTEIGEYQAIDDDGFNVIGGQLTNSKSAVNRYEEMQNKERIIETQQQSNGKVSKKRDQAFRPDQNIPFKCSLCHKW